MQRRSVLWAHFARSVLSFPSTRYKSKKNLRYVPVEFGRSGACHIPSFLYDVFRIIVRAVLDLTSEYKSRSTTSLEESLLVA